MQVKQANKILSLLLAVALLLAMIPLTAAAEAGGCTHDCADGTCAYIEGADCRHAHDEDCGYAEEIPEIPCDLECEEETHADGCGYTPAEPAAPCVHDHNADCGYVEAVDCDHVCDADCGGLPPADSGLTLGGSIAAAPNRNAPITPLMGTMSVSSVSIGGTALSDGGTEVSGATWTAATNTLTLAASGSPYGPIAISCSSGDSVTIEVTGAVVINGSTATPTAISCNGSLSITGSGALTANGGEGTSSGGHGVYAYSSITVNAPTTASGGGGASTDGNGIYAGNGDITINAATTASGGKGGSSGGHGISANYGNIIIKAETTASGGNISDYTAHLGVNAVRGSITFAGSGATLIAQDRATTGTFSVTKDFSGQAGYSWQVDSVNKGSDATLTVSRSTNQYTVSLVALTDITAAFTDANFLAAVRAALNKDASDPIYDTDVAGETTLDVAYEDIKSLAGIEHFTSLTELDCSGNQLTALPATLPSGLTELDCSDNQLTVLSALPDSLELLYCNSNRLTALPATLPSGLTELDCSDNQLTVLSALPDSLELLYCHNNRLTALPATLPSGLTYLGCSDNQLTTLPALPTGLIQLDCSQNRLTGFDVTGLSSLGYLDCTYNYLADTTAVTGFTGTWNNIQFQFTPQHASGFKAVTNITGLPATAAAGTPLTLSGTVVPADATNKTIVWSVSAYDEETMGANVSGSTFSATAAGTATVTATIANGFAAGTAYTQDFDITVTGGYTDITADFTDPNFRAAVRAALGKDASDPIYDTDVAGETTLDIAYEDIKSLAGIEHFTSLTELDCYGNQLTALPALPSGLTWLDCSNNQLTALPALPTGLEYLNCGGNQLTTLPATLPTGLTWLNCSNNQLTALPATLPNSLTKLDCSNNQLTALPALPSALTQLYCSQNRLTGLNVTGLSLSYLNCSYNYMEDTSAVTGFSGPWGWDNLFNTFEPQHAGGFKAVTNITGVPAAAVVGTPLTLTGTVIPADAANKTIVWSVSADDEETTGAKISGSTFTATAAGTATVTATITNGFAADTDYEQDFNITVTAGGGATTYLVTVNNGTGGGKYAQGATVTITANTAPSGQVFDKWTSASSGVSFANANSASTTFTMPANAVTVTATYKSSGGGGGGGGGGSSAQTTPTTPTTPDTGTNTITTPKGQPPVTDSNGNTTLPGGGTVTTEGGAIIDAPAGTTIDKNGNITIPPNQQAEMMLPGGQGVTLPGGSTISGSGSITTGGNTKISLPGDKTIDVPAGSTISSDGKLTMGAGGGSVSNGDGVTLHIAADTVLILDEEAPLGYFVSASNPFADMKSGDWFYDNVMFVYTHGLFSGTGASTFSPGAPMTRAMFVTVLARLAGIDLAGGETWYAQAVEWAKANGISDGTNPNNPITREQMAVMLYNYMEYKGIAIATDTADAFADEDSVSPWALEAVKAIQAMGVVSGKPGNLYGPQATATRAEVATVFANLIKYLAK